MLPDPNNPHRDRLAGLKRIRIIASVLGAVMFGFTGAQQFSAEAPEMVLPGTLITAFLGFTIIFVVMTIVIVIFRMFQKGN